MACSLSVADGCPSVALVALNKLSSSSCIFSFHSLEVGMVGDVVATLHQSHRMRVNLGDGCDIVVGQTAYGMLYVQFMLAHNGSAAVAQ